MPFGDIVFMGERYAEMNDLIKNLRSKPEVAEDIRLSMSSGVEFNLHKLELFYQEAMLPYKAFLHLKVKVRVKRRASV